MSKFTHLLVLVIGMSAGLGTSLVFNSTVDRCQAIVLSDLQKHSKFTSQLAQYTAGEDFLTTLTREK